MRQCRLHVPQIGQAAETLGASQLADHTETVENRHLQIQEHSIGRISMDEVKGFTSVCHFDHAVPTASKSSAIVRPRPDGGIRASYFGAGRPCMAPSAFTQYSADPGHTFDEPSERGSHEEFLERPVPSFIVNTGQLAPQTISWALSQGMWDKVSACLTE
jgi:hypothetical protein